METLIGIVVLSAVVVKVARWLGNNPEIKQAIARRIAGSASR